MYERRTLKVIYGDDVIKVKNQNDDDDDDFGESKLKKKLVKIFILNKIIIEQNVKECGDINKYIVFKQRQSCNKI